MHKDYKNMLNQINWAKIKCFSSQLVYALSFVYDVEKRLMLLYIVHILLIFSGNLLPNCLGQLNWFSKWPAKMASIRYV